LTTELMLVICAGDFERHHGEQPLLCVEVERSWAAVDLGEAQRDLGKAAHDSVGQHARDTAAPAQRPRERRSLAAAVAGQLDV
jgi:hypothetical protein